MALVVASPESLAELRLVKVGFIAPCVDGIIFCLVLVHILLP